jgi:hypothetical protein
VTGNETASKMGIFWCFVKSLSTHSVLTNESGKLLQNGVAGIFAGSDRSCDGVAHFGRRAFLM